MEGRDLLGQTSVIICTVDRLSDLAQCLDSLRPFQSALAEILIVNNGPRLESVTEIGRQTSARVITEARRGVSFARNAGVRAANGNILVFLDDDTLAEESWLPTLIAPLADPKADCVMGTVRATEPSLPIHQAFEKLAIGSVPHGPAILDARAPADPFPLRMAMNGFTMNVAFRRDVFERFGYFDERFGRGTRIGSGEDTDFFFNILRRGGRIMLEPRAVVAHAWPSEWDALRRSVFQGACGHTALLAKYFIEEPSLRGAVLRYAVSRLTQTSAAVSLPRSQSSARIPRLPFILGSLYGPIAFLLS